MMYASRFAHLRTQGSRCVVRSIASVQSAVLGKNAAHQEYSNSGEKATSFAAVAAGILGASVVLGGTDDRVVRMEKPVKDRKTSLRKKDFPLLAHNHGKTRVRVLKVKRDKSKHEVYEYNVTTKLFSDLYSQCFTEDKNDDLVATDTQRNTVYVIAKRSKADSPEQFAVHICTHFLNEYPMLKATEVEIDQVLWERANVDGKSHNHGFLKNSPETASTHVRLERGKAPVVTSFIRKMTIIKTTQSGFENYLMDKYTLLPPTTERCLATELDAAWTYGTNEPINYSEIRQTVRNNIIKGLFGPASTGVYSVSLQATIYDAACLVLSAAPQVASIKIDTPNLHYLPFMNLERLGEKFEDDIFVPTNEPSGTITCTVQQKKEARKLW